MKAIYIITNRHGLCSLYFFSFGAFIPYQAASFSMPSFAGALISSQVLHHENGRGSLGRYRELNSSLSFFDCCAGARSQSHLTDSLANIGAVPSCTSTKSGSGAYFARVNFTSVQAQARQQHVHI